MRKLMMLAAMLAMVLVAAAPAFAQVDVTTGDVDNSDNSATQYCTQVQAAFANQGQYGDATSGDATGDASANVASIAQELGISQEAVQNCVQGDNNAVGNEDVTTNGVDDNGNGMVDEAGETAVATSSSAASSSAAAGSAAAGTSVLPDTGGASLFTLGAGALLVGGGLLARRIFR